MAERQDQARPGRRLRRRIRQEAPPIRRHIRSQSKHYLYKAPGEPRKTYPNLIRASLGPTGPMQCGASDMTAFWASKKHWELTLCTDLRDDGIVAYGPSAKKGDPSAYYDGMAGFLAMKEKRPEMRTIFRSDQRSVYSSEAFNKMLLPHDITRTMSRVGTPADNGATEAIDGWAKAEMFVDFRIATPRTSPSRSRTMSSSSTKNAPCAAWDT